MSTFVRLNEAKDQVLGEYTYGSSFRDEFYTRFGPEGIPDKDFLDRGLYKLIDGDEPLPKGKMYGAVNLSIKGTKVTRTHDIIDIPVSQKVPTVDSLIDLLEREGVLSPSVVSEIRD